MKQLSTPFTYGSRTKLIKALIEKACIEAGATEQQAENCAESVENIFIKKNESEKNAAKNDVDGEAKETKKEKSDTLLFLSPSEVKKIAAAFKQEGFIPDKVIKQKVADKQAKEIAALIGKLNFAVDGVDIALFGRMVAQAASMQVEAAASFSHAISTHKVTNEVEFFSALDDESKEPGSAHIGSLEFNSATYYRYVSLNIGQLWENMAGQNVIEAVKAFTRALYTAIPAGRQTTQSGACWWEYARIFIRRGQRLQVPFETAVKADGGGFLSPSKKVLDTYLDKKEKLAGSLFGKVAEIPPFGDDDSFTIDALINSITSALKTTASTKSAL